MQISTRDLLNLNELSICHESEYFSFMKVSRRTSSKDVPVQSRHLRVAEVRCQISSHVGICAVVPTIVTAEDPSSMSEHVWVRIDRCEQRCR